MNYIIRKITDKDKNEVLSMMRTFYRSNVVLTNGSEEIFDKDIKNCIEDNPFLEGFVFEKDRVIMGYAMISKSYSTEFAKFCIWFEDLYLKPEYRGRGIILEFIEYIKNNNPDCVFKLEAEKENEHAIHVYKKAGFKVLEYSEMIFEQ